MARKPAKSSSPSSRVPIVSVAPMVDVTDRHFRSLIRIMTKRTLLYTPMFLARRVAQRKRHEVAQMLLFRPEELPLAVQLGGDDVRHIMGAARKCQDAGFSEINLNLGCPAGTAQERNFGATLMKPPHDKITHLVRTMTSQLDTPVSVKVRIGVDSHDDYPFFRDFIGRLHAQGGCNRFVVHARKALLDGISTRQNRLDELVPLRHEWVYRLKQEMPHVLRQYAEYALAEQDQGVESRREMLLRPTNQLFQGLPVEKRVFASLLRSPSAADRPQMFGQELLQVLQQLPAAVDSERKHMATQKKSPRYQQQRPDTPQKRAMKAIQSAFPTWAKKKKPNK
ncbi:hypothetical protein DYB30_009000 [Aphanomyces astaci]|uniref:DUS-like FMN-binding domain-containing protein n=1 Tax=Aphanomyces astaci TaxID=112090 RepID=A0A397FG47_APHAT|nr:hypothetical protein DYB30_009000 [Aphanomyces astaci]RHZ25598.1 hypothetical protein DYB31_009371 [Aphanomyces astaci]